MDLTHQNCSMDETEQKPLNTLYTLRLAMVELPVNESVVHGVSARCEPDLIQKIWAQISNRA